MKASQRSLILFIAVLITALLAFLPGSGAKAQPATVNLYAGWNILTYVGPTAPVGDALSEVSGKYNVVYGLDAGEQDWDSFDPNAPPFLSELQELQQFSAYMILMTEDGSLTFDPGSLPSQALPVLYTGWNLFGYFGGTMDVGDALASIDGDYSVVYGLDGQEQDWDSYDPSAPPFLSELQQLQQLSGYVIRMTQGPGGGGDELEIVGLVPPEELFEPDEFPGAAQSLADAVAELNGFELAFVQSATGGANEASLDSDLVEIAARAMSTAQIAAELGNNMAAQEGDETGEAGPAELYYAVARMAYALVIDAQNLRDGLESGSVTPSAAASFIAEYGIALWNPGPTPFGHPFRAYVDDPSVLDGLAILDFSMVPDLLAGLGGAASLEAWLSASGTSVTKTLSIPATESGTGEPDPFDPELLELLATAPGQIDGQSARLVAAAQLGLLSEAGWERPGSGPSQIEVAFFEGGAIVDSAAIAAEILPTFAGGSATVLFAAASGLQVAAASKQGGETGAANISFNGASDPTIVKTIPLDKEPQGPPVDLSITLSDGGQAGGFDSETWKVIIDVSWHSTSNFRIWCSGGYYGYMSPIKQLVTERDGEGTSDAFYPPGEWSAGCTASSPLLYRFLGKAAIRFIVGGGDDDGDGVGNLLDKCPNTFVGTRGVLLLSKAIEQGTVPADTKTFAKVNSDGCPEGEGEDFDKDTILDNRDNCPKVANAGQEDFDQDGIGDACDADDDGDGIHDLGDACPNTVGGQVRAGCSQVQLNSIDPDGDERCDNTKVCPTGKDNCPSAYNPGQEDTDLDDAGNICDPDDDNDTVADAPDQCDPDGPNPISLETLNGFQDGDGCADSAPSKVIVSASFTEVIQGPSTAGAFGTTANMTADFAAATLNITALTGSGSIDVVWRCFDTDDGHTIENGAARFSVYYGIAGSIPFDSQTGQFSATILPTIFTSFVTWSDPFTNDQCEHINDTEPDLGDPACAGGVMDGTISPNGQASVRTDWACEDVEIFGSWSGGGVVQ